jgi:hypothetical protein
MVESLFLLSRERERERERERDIKVSMLTVKSRYERLVNIGLIKSVKPEIDLSKIDRGKKNEFFGEETIRQLEEQKKHFHVKVEDNMKVKMQCEYCGGPIHAKPKVLEFANIQRFFCCIGCKNHYKEKHEGRIQSIVEQYKEMQKEAKKIT